MHLCDLQLWRQPRWVNSLDIITSIYVLKLWAQLCSLGSKIELLSCEGSYCTSWCQLDIECSSSKFTKNCMRFLFLIILSPPLHHWLFFFRATLANVCSLQIEYWQQTTEIILPKSGLVNLWVYWGYWQEDEWGFTDRKMDGSKATASWESPPQHEWFIKIVRLDLSATFRCSAANSVVSPESITIIWQWGWVLWIFLTTSGSSWPCNLHLLLGPFIYLQNVMSLLPLSRRKQLHSTPPLPPSLYSFSSLLCSVPNPWGGNAVTWLFPSTCG